MKVFRLLLLPTLLTCSVDAVAEEKPIASDARSMGAPYTDVRGDTSGVSFRIDVGKLELTSISTPQGKFDRLRPAGGSVHLRHGRGLQSSPETAVVTAYIAVPLGGEIASVEVKPGKLMQQQSARLYPIQDPEGAKLGEREKESPFVFDPKHYYAAPIVPGLLGKPAAIQQVDANIYRLTFSVLDYEPTRGLLSLYDSLDVAIKFSGKGQCFTQSANEKLLAGLDEVDRVHEAMRYRLLDRTVNREIAAKGDCPVLNPPFFGAQYIIVTHPDFLDAAEALRAHRVARGISTHIETTSQISAAYGDGSGEVTDDQIRDFVRDFHDESLIRPRWLMLLGDAEFIPTHYSEQLNFNDAAYNAGDQFYGQLDGNAESIPVLGIGRLPVDTAEQATTIVDKLIAYDNAPPDANTSGHFAFAAEFQDTKTSDPIPDGIAVRAFAQTAEDVRSHLVSEAFLVDRIYRTNTPEAPPMQWIDGTEIPQDLQMPAFAWDGDTQDVIDVANDGRGIILHRDHGWWGAWGTPRLTTPDLQQISVSDNAFPLVLSINCASGIFDNETVDDPANIAGTGYGPAVDAVFLAEQFVRKADGALAVIGDTRWSGTWANNDMTKGLFDAMFAGYQPFGNDSDIRTLGDVLVHAKAYLASTGISADELLQENTIYNLLGDPAQTVVLEAPWLVAPQDWRWLERATELVIPVTIALRDPPCAECPVDHGKLDELVAVAQNPRTGEVVARDVVGQSSEAVLQLGDYRGDVQVTFSGPGFTSHKATIKGIR